MALEITDTNFEELVLKSDKPVLDLANVAYDCVDYWGCSL